VDEDGQLVADEIAVHSAQVCVFWHRWILACSRGLRHLAVLRFANESDDARSGYAVFLGDFRQRHSSHAVAGHRNEKDFHADVVRRNSEIYPDAVEVDSIVQEACCHLALILNRAKSGESADA
jgi:hypothetical protein